MNDAERCRVKCVPVKRKLKKEIGFCRGDGGSKLHRGNDCYEVIVELDSTAGQMHQVLTRDKRDVAALDGCQASHESELRPGVFRGWKVGSR